MAQIHSGILLDETTTITLGELIQACDVKIEVIIEMVEQGILEPLGENPADWHFTMIALQRTKTVTRLQKDLGVNLAGAALVLELLDEIRWLREHLISV